MRASLPLGLLLGSACQPIDWTPPADAVFSEGCHGAEPAQTVASETIEAAGRTRAYTIRFPGSYRNDYPFPLVFMFHGAGASGPEFRELVALEQASRARAIFVYPNAQPDAEGVARWVGVADGPDFALVAALREQLAATWCIDEARVFGAGFSNGAAFTHELACAGKVDGFAAVAGGGPQSPVCTQARPGLVAHGTADPVVDFALGEASREHWRLQNGCDDTTEPSSPGPCVAYRGCEAALSWCEHDDPVQIAHGWPEWIDGAIWGLLGAI